MAPNTQRRIGVTSFQFGLAALFAVPVLSSSARAEALKEPPVLRSAGGVLDIIMVARPNTKPILGLNDPIGWVYDICRNPGRGATSCPARSFEGSDAYGGTRLALRAGDTLKVRLVNKLPPIANGEAKHALEPGHEDLALNPTNLHTHGLIVEPRKPTVARPTWGDNIFVLAYNTANGVPQTNRANAIAHQHGPVMGTYIDYEIDIPANHPSGSYWFHPHVHGIALNQVTAGLGGIITIGDSGDYACEDQRCLSRWPEANVRHLILKDMQVEHTALTPKTLTQQDPDFCASPPADGEPARKGFCTGQFGDPADPATDHTGGKWFYPVNGQVYPTIAVTSPKGELWRLTNESASVSYDLHLTNDTLGSDMVMQVISVDGVSISASDVVSTQQMAKFGGTKLRLTSCPSAAAGGTAGVAPPVCVTSLKMYPSSRVEVHVSYRGSDGRVTTPPKGAHATFKTVGLQTGAAGDTWPSVDLAEVVFQGGHSAGQPEFVNLHDGVKTALSASGVLGSPGRVSPAAAPVLTAGTNCAALPAGHKRRIYYGVPTGIVDGFGLAYEEVDADGNPVGVSPTDLSVFDPTAAIVCLPLAKGNVPVKEVWELVNLAGEDHNFHIHQTKFRVLESSTPMAMGARLINASTNPPQLPFPAGSVLHDNIPLPAGEALDDTGCAGIAEWKGGSCRPTKTTVEIAFSQVGDFVYHCHILEHEDGGMMAKITVLKNP